MQKVTLVLVADLLFTVNVKIQEEGQADVTTDVHSHWCEKLQESIWNLADPQLLLIIGSMSSRQSTHKILKWRSFWICKVALVLEMMTRPQDLDLNNHPFCLLKQPLSTPPWPTSASPNPEPSSSSQGPSSSQPPLQDGWDPASSLQVHLKTGADLAMLWSPLSTHLPCLRKPLCFCWAYWPAQCKDQIGSFYLPSGGAASLSALPLEGVYLACW